MKSNLFKEKLIHSFFGNILTLAFSLLFPWTITTWYSTETLGKYTYNLSIISMMIFLACLGLISGLMYFIPRYGTKYVTSTFIIVALMSLLIIFISIPLFKDTYIRLMLPLLLLLALEQLFKGLFQTNHQIKEFFYINLIAHQGLKIVVSIILALLLGPSFINLIIATYIGALCATVIYFIYNKKMFTGIHFSMEVIKYSAPLMISSVLYLMMMNVDKIMIGNLMNKSYVAIYAVAMSIAMFPSIFLSILNTVFPPVISKMYHQGKIHQLKAYYLKSVRLLTLLSSIVIAILIIFRKPILSLYGPEYIDGQVALIYISIGQLINAAVGSVWYTIQMTGHSKWNMYGELSTFFINMTLNFLLIPIYGINGAAFATMISTSYSNILGFFLVRYIFKKSINNPEICMDAPS